VAAARRGGEPPRRADEAPWRAAERRGAEKRGAKETAESRGRRLGVGRGGAAGKSRSACICAWVLGETVTGFLAVGSLSPLICLGEQRKLCNNKATRGQGHITRQFLQFRSSSSKFWGSLNSKYRMCL
jgi:hypothetical protein